MLNKQQRNFSISSLYTNSIINVQNQLAIYHKYNHRHLIFPNSDCLHFEKIFHVIHVVKIHEWIVVVSRLKIENDFLILKQIPKIKIIVTDSRLVFPLLNYTNNKYLRAVK